MSITPNSCGKCILGSRIPHVPRTERACSDGRGLSVPEPLLWLTLLPPLTQTLVRLAPSLPLRACPMLALLCARLGAKQGRRPGGPSGDAL